MGIKKKITQKLTKKGKIKQEKERDYTQERLDRCLPAAQLFLHSLSTYEGHALEEENDDKRRQAYDGLAREWLKIGLATNLQINEFDFAVRLVARALDATKTIVSQSLNQHLLTMQAIKFGGPLTEMHMTDLHTALEAGKLKEDSAQ